jgi:hypothetical protein
MRRVIPLFSILAWLSCTALYSGTLVPTYATYFGGTGDANTVAAVALDSSGNVIVAGITSSQTLPGTANAFQPTKAVGFPDNQNVYIAKFNPTGQVLLWASFLGGDEQDRPTSVAVDAGGNVYVVGFTSSSIFPVTPGAYQGAAIPGASTGFASKISTDGVGSFAPTVITAGAIGTGETPISIDGVFLLCLNSTGTALVFGAYLGGDGFQGSRTTSLAIGPQGTVYVAGIRLSRTY